MSIFPSITTDEFVKAINDLRKKNKDTWYYWSGFVNGKSVSIDGYNTWLRRFRVNGMMTNTVMDISVAKFTQQLKDNLG